MVRLDSFGAEMPVYLYYSRKFTFLIALSLTKGGRVPYLEGMRWS